MPLAKHLPFTSPRRWFAEQFQTELHSMRPRRDPAAVEKARAYFDELKARQRARDAADDDAAFFAGLAKAHGYLPSRMED